METGHHQSDQDYRTFSFYYFLLLYIQDVSRKALGVISRADTIVRQAQAAFENG